MVLLQFWVVLHLVWQVFGIIVACNVCVGLDFLDGNFVGGCFDGVYDMCDEEFV